MRRNALSHFADPQHFSISPVNMSSGRSPESAVTFGDILPPNIILIQDPISLIIQYIPSSVTNSSDATLALVRRGGAESYLLSALSNPHGLYPSFTSAPSNLNVLSPPPDPFSSFALTFGAVQEREEGRAGGGSSGGGEGSLCISLYLSLYHHPLYVLSRRRDSTECFCKTIDRQYLTPSVTSYRAPVVTPTPSDQCLIDNLP